MVELDIRSYRGRSGGRPLRGGDPWDGVKQPGADGVTRCVYCGHLHDEHGGESAMYLRPGARKRTRLGLLVYWCTRCAADKGTGQVFCYLAPGGLLDRIARDGGTLADEGEIGAILRKHCETY